MKIVLATSIYPPEVGGPAFYAESLKQALERQGHIVDVAVLSLYKRLPSGIRHVMYAIRLFRCSRGVDAIIAFDIHATGLASVVVGTVRGIPAIIRVGGDFLWEHYVNRTGDLLPLPQFYSHRERWGLKEKLILALMRAVIVRATLVCSSGWIVELWRKSYALNNSRVHVIENAIGAKLESIPPARKNFLMFGRQIPLKNTAAFRSAFAKAKKKHPEIELEEGIVSQKELMEKMRSCYAVVLPSISDVTPNYILEAMRYNKPFILTKYSGYAEPYKAYGVLIDPLSIDDMARGIELLADPNECENRIAKVATFTTLRTYDDIARDFISFISNR